jgi:uncharacterized metal-binding protein YceD (DUF177 family)
MKNKEFDIPFTGLKLGKHEFEYAINNSFFEHYNYDEFNSANLKMELILNKLSTFMEAKINVSGTVNVNCDLTDLPFDLPIEAELDLVIKYGDQYDDENESLLIIPHQDHKINLAQYMYEMSVLAVPLKRVHPKVADGSLSSPALDLLDELSVKELKEEKNEDNTDPRWDALKKLKTDKNK